MSNQETLIDYICQKCKHESKKPLIYDDSWVCNRINPLELANWEIKHGDMGMSDDDLISLYKQLYEESYDELVPFVPNGILLSWNDKQKIYCNGLLAPKHPEAQFLLNLMSQQDNTCFHCGAFVDPDQDSCIECHTTQPITYVGL